MGPRLRMKLRVTSTQKWMNRRSRDGLRSGGKNPSSRNDSTPARIFWNAEGFFAMLWGNASGESSKFQVPSSGLRGARRDARFGTWNLEPGTRKWYSPVMSRKASASSESSHGFNDIIGLILLVVALLLFAAQFSFDRYDLKAVRVPPNESTHNLIGPAGA